MAIDYEGIANAALVFVTGLILWFGGRKGLAGAKAPAEAKAVDGTQGTLKLDMAMIDNRAVMTLAGSVEALNMTVMATNKLIEREMKDREIDEEVERRIKERTGK